MSCKKISSFFILLVAITAGRVHAAGIQITEWMYSGTNGEFVELTNTSASPIDMANWSYSDADQQVGDVSLSAFGIVQPGESVILTETADAAFRTAWGLAGTVDVIGSNLNSNLGRNDQINIYDDLGALADRLQFGDQDFPGTIRTQNKSGNPISLAALGANNPAAWQLAFVGDGYNTHTSTGGDLGNPGYFPVPEPGTFVLGLLGALGLFTVARRRRS